MQPLEPVVKPDQGTVRWISVGGIVGTAEGDALGLDEGSAVGVALGTVVEGEAVGADVVGLEVGADVGVVVGDIVIGHINNVWTKSAAAWEAK